MLKFHLKKTFSTILFLGVLTACVKVPKSKEGKLYRSENPTLALSTDTILEQNNPQSLDLGKHQLYIDTTRNSENYKKLINWRLNRKVKKVYSGSGNEIDSKAHSYEIQFRSFPKTWISLEKLNVNFVIYAPCDGYNTIVDLNEGEVHFFFRMESQVQKICDIKRMNDSRIELFLETDCAEYTLETSNFSITPTASDHVFLITYKSMEWFVTALENVIEFDMVVNHCPIMKRDEYDGFDQ